MAAQDLVEYVARNLVDDPTPCRLKSTPARTHRHRASCRRRRHGKVIGRNGSVAKALRTLLKVMSARDGEIVSLEIS